MVSDNYFRSVSGLPPAPYPDQPLTQLALEQNNSDHLTKLARLEVESILRTLEQPGMYVDGNAMHQISHPLWHLPGVDRNKVHPADGQPHLPSWI